MIQILWIKRNGEYIEYSYIDYTELNPSKKTAKIKA